MSNVFNPNSRYLITPTLLNSFLYFQSSESETALADFEKTIKKEFTTNKYCEAGNMWENRLCKPSLEEDNKLVLEIVDKIKNDEYQVPVQKQINVNGVNILLYGKCDCVGYDIIRDIKSISGEYEIGKYRNSMQHRIYMYCSSIKQFEYLITKIKIKEDKDTEKVIDVEPIDNFGEYYAWQDRYESDIYECINNFFDYLKVNEELGKIYFELWKCRF